MPTVAEEKIGKIAEVFSDLLVLPSVRSTHRKLDADLGVTTAFHRPDDGVGSYPSML